MTDEKISIPLVGRDELNSQAIITPASVVVYNGNSQGIRSPPVFVESLNNGSTIG